MNEEQAFLLPKAAAASVLESAAQGMEPSLDLLKPFPRLVQVDGGFSGLRSSLKALCSSLPRPKSSRDSSPEFESQGAIIVHKALRHLPEELLGDAEFWLWMNVCQCRDIVTWRHGDEAHVGNYGMEAKIEGLLCRMFMRAHLVFLESDPDPYELARKGTQDFWRSFMLRRNYACVKPMARAIARRVNFGREGIEDDLVRKLGPRLTQLHGSYAYEMFDADRCASFVESELGKVLS